MRGPPREDFVRKDVLTRTTVFAQWKWPWTCHKSHFMRGFSGKTPPPRTATTVLREPCHKSHSCEMLRPRTATTVLCQLAQSKCTWTYHKSHFMQKFRGKMLRPRTPTTVLCEPAKSKCKWTSHKSPADARIYRKKYWTTDGAP